MSFFFFFFVRMTWAVNVVGFHFYVKFYLRYFQGLPQNRHVCICYFRKAASFCQILTPNIFNFCAKCFGEGPVYVTVISR